MPPLFIIEEDEELELSVGDPPPQVPATAEDPNPAQPEDDRTVFLFRRLRYSERQAFFQLFNNRGRTDMDGYNMAVIATCLKGWRRLMGKNGEIAFPALDEIKAETKLEDMRPGYPFWLPGTPLFEQRRRVLAIVECLPLDITHNLAQSMLNPAPEALLKNWLKQSNGTNGSPPRPPDTAIPASIAEPSAPTVANGSPAMMEA